LDPHVYPAPAALLRHLLAQTLVIAYPDQAERGHASRWLAWIAQHMGTNRDLCWWDIPTWMAGNRRALNHTVGLMFGLGLGLVFGLAAGLRRGLMFGLLAGVMFGLLAGIMFGRGARRSQPLAFSVRRPSW